jgi:hypothetical protein
MTIVHEGFSSAAPGGSLLTLDIPAPSGIQAGDVLVAAVVGSVASGTLSITASGWTVQSEQFDNLAVLTILTKVAGGSEPSTYRFDYSVVAATRRGAIQRFSGVDNTSPMDATPIKNNGSGTTATGLSITTVSDDAWIGMYAGWSANSTDFTSSDLTVRYNINRNGGAGDLQASAGASGNKTATINNSTWRTIMAALKPATEEPNLPPTVTPVTADEAILDASGAQLEFIGTDPAPYVDDITYQVQISDSSDLVSGEHISDNFMAGGGMTIHPQPLSSGDTWEANIQVDDRPGQSFLARGGILKKIGVRLVNDSQSPNGTARILVYEHQGTYGTSSAPLNPANPADTPTPGWIAESDGIALDGTMSSSELWYDFNFTGNNQIRLVGGRHYIFTIDWIPANRNSNNTWGARGDSINSGTLHGGNVYIDGASEPNNGSQATWDLYFRIYEESILIDKVSDVDSDFANIDTPADTDPFNSGDTVRYTSGALTPTVYYWRARGKDPAGSNSFGDWTITRSFSAESGNLANLSVVFEDTVLSADGSVAVSGSLDQTFEDATLSADGSVPVSGSLDAALADATLAADAAVLVSASLDVSYEDTTLEASGTVGSTPITADLDVTFEDMVLSADGSVLISAELGAVLEDGTLNADGSVAVSGQLDADLDDATLDASGAVLVSASLETVIEDTALEASGTVGSTPITADLEATFEDTVLSADGTISISGSLETALADATLAADAAVLVSALLDAVFEDTTLEASGTVGEPPNNASLDVTFEDTMLSADGAVLLSGSLAVNLAGTILTASAAVLISGSLDALLEDTTLDSYGRVGQVSGIPLYLHERRTSIDLDRRERSFILGRRERRRYDPPED